MNTRRRILAAAVGAGLAISVADAALDYAFFYDGSFQDLLVLDVPAHEIYVRLLIIASFGVFGWVVGRMVAAREQAYRLLHGTEQRFRQLYEYAPLGYQSLDAAGAFVQVNRKWLAMFGYEENEVLGRPFRDFLDPASHPQFEHCFAQLKAQGNINDVEFTVQRKDGARVLITLNGTVYYDYEGKFLRTHCVLIDITSQREAEFSLAREAAVNAALAELSQTLIQTYSIEEISAEVLEVAQRLTASAFGYVGYIDASTGSLVVPTLTKGIWDSCEVEDKSLVFDKFNGLWGWVLNQRETLMTNAPAEDPRSVGIPAGHLPVERFLSAPSLFAGALVGQVALANATRDYTYRDQELIERLAALYAVAVHRKRTEHEMGRIETEKAVVLNSISEHVIYYHDPQLRIAWANQAAADSLQRPVDSLIGEQCFRLWDDLDEPCAGCPVHQTFFDGQPHEWSRTTPDGRSWLIKGYPVKDQHGGVAGVVEVTADITHRQQAARALEHYANRLQVLHEIDRAILKAESPETIAQAVLRHVHELLPCTRASVIVFDDDSSAATVLAVQDDRDTKLGEGIRITLGSKAVMNREIVQRGAYVVDDIDALPELTPTARTLRDQGIRSYVNIPLLVRGELIGSLNIGATVAHCFEPDHVEIAQEVANQLAIAIHQARLYEQIQQHATELERRVAERTAELRDANVRLEQLSRVKDEFVANVSHELRTPITNLKLRQHLLALQPERLDDHLDVLRRETARLEGIIESLLYLSRLDQGRIGWDPAPVDLNALVEQYAADRLSLAEARDLRLEVHRCDNMPPIVADESLLGQALSVLLTNALNYTPPGGVVTVAAHKDHEDGQAWYGFHVTDTGPGIPAEERELLFQRFFRGSAAYESGMAGTGLGLAIVKEIIGRHGGRVEVESEGVPGKGARFAVWLPQNADQAQE